MDNLKTIAEKTEAIRNGLEIATVQQQTRMQMIVELLEQILFEIKEKSQIE